MQTDDEPIRIHNVPSELARIREETQRLLTELNGRRPQGALLIRARDLRARTKVLGTAIERLLCEEMSVELAFRERTGRNAVDGDAVTEEDKRRAAQIVEGFGL